jgi:hypothetical protein
MTMPNPLGIGGQKAGEKGRNPRGRPSGTINFVDRAKHITEKYTAGEILELHGDAKRFKKLPSFDALIITRLAEALGADGTKAMNSILDRLLGKPVQPVASTVNLSGSLTLDERRKEAIEKAEKLLMKAREKK